MYRILCTKRSATAPAALQVGTRLDVAVVPSQTGGHGRKRLLRISVTADGPTRVLRVVDTGAHPSDALPATAHQHRHHVQQQLHAAAAAARATQRASGSGAAGGGVAVGGRPPPFTRTPARRAASQRSLLLSSSPTGRLARGPAHPATTSAAATSPTGAGAAAPPPESEWQVEVSASVAGVAVSLVSERRELLYALLQGFHGSLLVGPAKVAAAASLAHVRWDNCLRGAAFPIMVYGPVGRSLFNTALLLPMPPPPSAAGGAGAAAAAGGSGGSGGAGRLLALPAAPAPAAGQASAAGAGADATAPPAPASAAASSSSPQPATAAGASTSAAGTPAAAVARLPPPALSVRLVVWRNRPGGVVCVQNASVAAAPLAVSIEETHLRELIGLASRMAAAATAPLEDLSAVSGGGGDDAGVAVGGWAPGGEATADGFTSGVVLSAAPAAAVSWRVPSHEPDLSMLRPTSPPPMGWGGSSSASGGAASAAAAPSPGIGAAGAAAGLAVASASPQRPVLGSPTGTSRASGRLRAGSGGATASGIAVAAAPLLAATSVAAAAGEDPLAVAPPPVARTRRLYFEELHIGEIRISASFAPTPYNSRTAAAMAAAEELEGAAVDGGGAAAASAAGGGGLVDSAVRLVVSLAHLEGAWVTLRPLDMRYALMRDEALGQVRTWLWAGRVGGRGGGGADVMWMWAWGRFGGRQLCVLHAVLPHDWSSRRLKLSAVIRQASSLCTPQNIFRHYMSCAVLELIKVVGSLDIFGDVVSERTSAYGRLRMTCSLLCQCSFGNAAARASRRVIAPCLAPACASRTLA